MSQFKPGDKVVVIAGPQKGEKVRTLKNRVDSVFFTNFPVRIKNQHYDAKGIWYAGTEVCLRHATTDEITAAQKPLRRGDLVEYCGDICVMFSEGEDSDGEYRIASLTGDPDHNWVKIDELTRISSIGKKVKRLKNKTGDVSKPTNGPWVSAVADGYTAERTNELDANAKLVAAAPDLLEALEDLLECPYHIDEATVSKAGLEATMNANPHQVVGNMSVALARVRKARAAIAKAVGEA